MILMSPPHVYIPYFRWPIPILGPVAGLMCTTNYGEWTNEVETGQTDNPRA